MDLDGTGEVIDRDNEGLAAMIYRADFAEDSPAETGPKNRQKMSEGKGWC